MNLSHFIRSEDAINHRLHITANSSIALTHNNMNNSMEDLICTSYSNNKYEYSLKIKIKKYPTPRLYTRSMGKKHCTCN